MIVSGRGPLQDSELELEDWSEDVLGDEDWKLDDTRTQPQPRSRYLAPLSKKTMREHPLPHFHARANLAKIFLEARKGQVSQVTENPLDHSGG